MKKYIILIISMLSCFVCKAGDFMNYLGTEQEKIAYNRFIKSHIKQQKHNAVIIKQLRESFYFKKSSSRNTEFLVLPEDGVFNACPTKCFCTFL